MVNGVCWSISSFFYGAQANPAVFWEDNMAQNCQQMVISV